MSNRSVVTSADGRGTLMRMLVLGAAASLGWGVPVAAQLAPETPRLMSPHVASGLGVHWLRAGTLPGDGEAVLVTWAMPGFPTGLRVRGGAGEGAGGTTAGFGGLDVQAPLLRGEGGTPFDLDWQGGVGVSVGEYVLVTLPVGVSGGVSWTSGAVWLGPYVAAGVAADLRLGEGAPSEEFRIHPSLDVGFDLSFDPSRAVVLRASASLGDRQALALGGVFGVGRPGR